MRISRNKQKLGYIIAQQFNSSVTCPIDNNLLESDGTSKVFGIEKERERATVPAPVTGYVTPLALAMHIRFSWVVLEKSQGCHVVRCPRVNDPAIMVPRFRARKNITLVT